MNDILAEKIWSVAKIILQTDTKRVGRPEFDNRKAFLGILYCLNNGIKWNYLPLEYGKISTGHGKFMKWIRAGKINKIFENIRGIYLEHSDAFKNWYAVDTSFSKAPYAQFSGKNPTDRGKRGIKKNIITDSLGAPLVLRVGPANQHDSKTLIPILRDLKLIKPKPFSIVAADSAYDSKELRKEAASEEFVLHAATNKRRLKDSPLVAPQGQQFPLIHN